MANRFCSNCGAEIAPDAQVCPSCGTKAKKMSTCAIVGLIFGVIAVLGIIIVVILAAILFPNFARARAQGQYTQCMSNMKNMATALEMYSTDNKGHYATSLAKLTPDYLRIIPTCASAGEDTYISTYQYEIADEKKGTHDAYTFYCRGHHHKDVGADENYPQYNSTLGLIPR